MNYEEMIRIAAEAAKEKEKCLIAVDGRCASGKTVFAHHLAQELNADLLHMDDFFLRPVQRTKERYETPGGNVDYERFEEEVLKPLAEGKAYWYQPFDCGKMELGQGWMRQPQKIVIVEGSYSMHPKLVHYYDLKIFLHVNEEIQMKRIRKRNPDKADSFKERWIPLEEKYFSTVKPEKDADFVFDTSVLF